MQSNTHLPFFVTIISLVKHWNLVHKSLSSRVNERGNLWFPLTVIAPRFCPDTTVLSLLLSSWSSSGVVRFCPPVLFRSLPRSSWTSLSRSRSQQDDRVGEPGVAGAGCIFSFLQPLTCSSTSLTRAATRRRFPETLSLSFISSLSVHSWIFTRGNQRSLLFFNYPI